MNDAQKEKRRGPRRRVLKGAIVAYNDRRSTISCSVRDISDTGARVRVDGSMSAPDTFLLVIELDGGQHFDPGNAAADARRTGVLNAFGFHVMRFTDREALLQLEAVLTRILKWLMARKRE